MTFRTLLTAVASVMLIAGVGVAGHAYAQSQVERSLFQSARSQGIVGELHTGFAAIRNESAATADIRAAVQAVNDARRQGYAASAREAGTSVDVAGAAMFESRILPGLPSGAWYRTASGQWVQKP